MSKKIKQVVVRTYPYGYTKSLDDLKYYLDKGYIVVMCNNLRFKETEVVDYILQKEVDE